jgi:nucleoside-diphosphate-sugar epimerase
VAYVKFYAGFIGSNLAIRLVQSGRVTIVDSCVEGCGGNLRNIAPIIDNVRLLSCDICDTHGARDEAHPVAPANYNGVSKHAAWTQS